MADYKKLALGALAGVLAGGAVVLAAQFAGEKPAAKPAVKQGFNDNRIYFASDAVNI